jgi:ABC-type dipeptide/oligopeptide/nickel transport system permease subunit
MFSRVIYGGRVSLMIGIGSVLLGLLLGGPAGIVAGYRGGWVDALIMRAMDVLLSFPGFILAAAIIAVLGIGVQNLIIALGLRTLPVLARVARNMTLSLRERAYIDAARVVGAGDGRILLRHILPNLLSTLLVVANLRIGSAILTGTALSFLGMGVPAGTAEWGAMLNAGMNYMRVQATHLMIFPGLAIVVTVLGINLLGDDLRDLWDPRLRS